MRLAFAALQEFACDPGCVKTQNIETRRSNAVKLLAGLLSHMLLNGERKAALRQFR